jgi:hypothetical protein
MPNGKKLCCSNGDSDSE